MGLGPVAELGTRPRLTRGRDPWKKAAFLRVYRVRWKYGKVWKNTQQANGCGYCGRAEAGGGGEGGDQGASSWFPSIPKNAFITLEKLTAVDQEKQDRITYLYTTRLPFCKKAGNDCKDTKDQ